MARTSHPTSSTQSRTKDAILPAILPKQTYENVSSAKARDWLRHNTDNRRLRRSKVDELKGVFQRGEYRLTHQGVAFGLDGRLLDGQHRLSALAEMEDGFSVVMSVTRGLDAAAFEVLDLGTRRSYSDALRIPDGLAECARYLAVMVNSNIGLTPQAIKPYVDFIACHYDLLVNGLSTRRRTWTTAPVRSAAIVLLARGVDPAYIREVYRALVTADFNAMPPIAQALFRAELNGRLKGIEKNDMFARCLKIFNPVFASNLKVQINDASAAVAEVREFIMSAVPASRLPAV